LEILKCSVAEFLTSKDVVVCERLEEIERRLKVAEASLGAAIVLHGPISFASNQYSSASSKNLVNQNAVFPIHQRPHAWALLAAGTLPLTNRNIGTKDHAHPSSNKWKCMLEASTLWNGPAALRKRAQASSRHQAKHHLRKLWMERRMRWRWGSCYRWNR
jgi:hypothetical protein